MLFKTFLLTLVVSITLAHDANHEVHAGGGYLRRSLSLVDVPISTVNSTSFNGQGIKRVLQTVTKQPSAPTRTSTVRGPSLKPSNKPTKSPTRKTATTPTRVPTRKPANTPTRVPTRKPANTPTRVPIRKLANTPTRLPTQKPANPVTKMPTRQPSKNPTRTPTRKPTPSPTSESTTIPNGPFITAATANERVIIPVPPNPSYDSARSNCPHLDNNLLNWHSQSTWGGRIPTTGNVTLPENSRVLVSQSVTGILSFVDIPASSELIFGENPSGISFAANGINVKGNLTIGSDTCRIETRVTITLHGDRPIDVVTNVPPPQYKGIAVTGRISIHGQRFYRTWTRLALTANPGDNVIMLQDKVNWMPGQEIVLVTTAIKDSREWHRNEVAIVKKVILNPRSGVGAAVFVTKALSAQHLATKGYQGEVGLLTRVIKIQGDTESEPTDLDPLNCLSRQSNYGDKAVPCPNSQLTGYGGHIIVYDEGKGYVEGVELYRMGQTNVMGRYPMHFHLLGENCRDCYFRDSSVHRSYYRCVSIHGTHYTQVSENVAYDVTGFCYYLEDGIEHDNRIEFNLGAHIHMIGPEPPTGTSQTTPIYTRSDTLNLPADVTASAFYITNIQNYVVGNAASGGWAGFAFPNLLTPLGPSRNVKIRPSAVTGLSIDGNTAHSTGWWWKSASAFYFGGSLYYNSDNILEYQAGRDLKNTRSTCITNTCESPGGCDTFCQPWEQAWVKVTNNKAFLVAGIGMGSWGGRMDVIGFECHDCGLAIMGQTTDGFSVSNLLGVCRTRTPIVMPNTTRASRMRADGFRWYDTNQEHILSDVTFRNCGYRSSKFDQYDQSATRGCGDESDIGCTPDSSVWSFVTHSDQHVPEVMQATARVKMENCGRRFLLFDFRQTSGPHPSANAGRLQNWYDTDGSVTGFQESSIVASALADAGMWWKADVDAVYEPQGPLWFYKRNGGPERSIGSFNMIWDSALTNSVGKTQCGNGPFIPCDYVGRIKHLGSMYANDAGLPITANADIVGPVGGFGWKIELDKGAPKTFRISQVEVEPTTPLLVSIAYPPGTSFQIAAYAHPSCVRTATYTCSQKFYQVDSVAAVRNSIGNTYYVDPNGVLTFRVIQSPRTFIGQPNFFLPQYSDPGRDGLGLALDRYERYGMRLPTFAFGPMIGVTADCPATGAYCTEMPPKYVPEVCPEGYTQTAYDTCRLIANGTVKKVFANGKSVTTSV